MQQIPQPMATPNHDSNTSPRHNAWDKLRIALGKARRGCGCMSTIIVLAVAALTIWGYLLDDDQASSSPKPQEQTPPDSLKPAPADTTPDPDPFEELNGLIGLEAVKQEVRSLANFAKVQQQRKRQGLKVPKLSYHLVFTGSPGTGKTTVARIVARIYKDLGILQSGHLVETDRSGLVAGYLGQTAIKTNAIIDSALNGVLFIDEAYALATEDGDSYGLEAISTLLKRMEDERDRLVVIVAGYSDEMQRFISSNPGLKSRFNRYIDFPDYSPSELHDIFAMYASRSQYTMTADASEFLRKQLNLAVKRKTRSFANARYVRNMFEKAIQHHANRIAQTPNASTEQLSQLTLNDLQRTFEP